MSLATSGPLCQPCSDTPTRFSYPLQIAAVAAAYFVTGKVGLDLAFKTTSVTAIWPPTGIALAAIVLGGPRLWPGVALGAFLTNVDTGVPIYTVIGITTGNTLEALVGAWLLRRVAGFSPTLESVRDVLALVLFGAVLSTMVSATIGVMSLAISNEVDFADFGSVWRTWWLGDMGGDLIVAPALLVAATYRQRRDRPPGTPAEAVLVVAALSGLAVFVFTQPNALLYTMFPLLVWAALRFWQLGAAVAALIIGVLGVVFTENREGPFADNTPDERLLLVVSFVAVAGVTAQILAALTSQRARAEQTTGEIASTLQDSLLAPMLPEVPGIESAAYFEPAGPGQRVGGDFYDMFEAPGGGWALVLGDVCGKGPDAAAITALARYTLRAAAARLPGPSPVLALLNEEILRQRPGEFCTVVHARLDLDAGSPRLTVSSSGHPLPVVIRASGAVATLGEPDVLLGFERGIAPKEDVHVLEAGDLVVFYTDGLTDAQAPAHIVLRAELHAVLADCAGLAPAEAIGLIRRRLLPGVSPPRDDIAIVAIRAQP